MVECSMVSGDQIDRGRLTAAFRAAQCRQYNAKSPVAVFQQHAHWFHDNAL